MTFRSGNFRRVHVVAGVANFVYMSEDEFLHKGTIGVDYIMTDKIVKCCHWGTPKTYRIIVRSPDDNTTTRELINDIGNVDEFRIYDTFRRYLTLTTCQDTQGRIFTVTISRYLDDTLTNPMDIPVIDPVVRSLSYWYSDTMRMLCSNAKW